MEIIVHSYSELGGVNATISGQPHYGIRPGSRFWAEIQAWKDAGNEWPEPEAPVVDMAAYARDKSWQVRTGGTTINGVAVKTDGESIALITAMAALAERDPLRSFEFDTASGPVTLTAVEAIAFSVAVGNWVQATFDRRAAVLTAIGNGDVRTTEQIDAAFIDVTAPWSAS